MNHLRLNKLADVLENFKSEVKNLAPLPGNGQVTKFSLDCWGMDDPSARWYGGVCSTTACAAGTAGLHSWFREQGFRLIQSPVGNYQVSFDGVESFYACGKFFDIGFNEAVFLFSANSYPHDRNGEKSVAHRIRYLLAGGQNRGRHAGLKKQAK